MKVEKRRIVVRTILLALLFYFIWSVVGAYRSNATSDIANILTLKKNNTAKIVLEKVVLTSFQKGTQAFLVSALDADFDDSQINLSNNVLFFAEKYKSLKKIRANEAKMFFQKDQRTFFSKKLDIKNMILSGSVRAFLVDGTVSSDEILFSKENDTIQSKKQTTLLAQQGKLRAKSGFFYSFVNEQLELLGQVDGELK